MGADMMIAGMVAPHQSGTKSVWHIDMDLARRTGHERIDAHDLDSWTDDDLERLAERLGDKDWDTLDDPEAPDRADLIRDTRATLHAALDLLIDGRRDVTAAQFGGRLYWVTGGLSWGDAPTDSYEELCAFDSLHLFDEPLPEHG